MPEIRSGIERLIKEHPEMLLLSSSANAEEAMPAIINLQPDVVIMDINMPGINGVKCIRKIKDDCPGIQFMIFSIYENDEKVFDALAAGASGYLLKKHPLKKYWKPLKNYTAGAAR